MGGAACATEGAIALAAYLVLEVEPGTALGYVSRGDDGDVIETEWGEALHLDVVDGGGGAALQHGLIVDARIVAIEGLTTVLEILDIVAVPYTEHGIYLREFNPYLADVFKHNHLKIFSSIVAPSL